MIQYKIRICLYFVLIWVFECSRFIIVFATGFGVADGMSFCLTLVVAGKYFPYKIPIIKGIILAGLGLGALSFSFITQIIVNPDNKQPTIEVNNGAAIDYYYTHDVYDNVKYIVYIYIYRFRNYSFSKG